MNVRFGPPGSLIRRVLSNIGWAVSPLPLTTALGAVQLGIQARVLGPEGLGVLSIFAATAALASGVIRPRGADAVIAFASRAVSQGNLEQAGLVVRACVALDIGSSILAYLVLAVVVTGLARLMPIMQHIELLLVYSLTIIFTSSYWTTQAVLRLVNRFQWMSWHMISLSVAKTLAMAVIYWRSGNIAHVVLAILGIAVLDAAALLFLAQVAASRYGIRLFRFGGGWWVGGAEFRRFQLQGYLRSLLKTVQFQSDVLLIGILGGTVQAGYYKVAKVFFDMTDMPLQTVHNVLSPEYARLWFSSRLRDLHKMLFSTSGALACLGGLGIGVFLVADDWILGTLFGPEFLVVRTTATVLLVAALINVVIVPYSGFQLAIGRAFVPTMGTAAAVFVSVSALCYLVPRLGAEGAAWAKVISMVFVIPLVVPPAARLLRHSEKVLSCQAKNVPASGAD